MRQRTRSRSTGDLRTDLSATQFAQLQGTPPQHSPPRSPIGESPTRPQLPSSPRKTGTQCGAKWGGADRALHEYAQRRGPLRNTKLSSVAVRPGPLLAGEPPERVIATLAHVTLVRPPLAWTQCPESVLQFGTLYLTTFRVQFVPNMLEAGASSSSATDIPLAAIHRLAFKDKHLATVSTTLPVLKVHGLDGGRVLRFLFAGEGLDSMFKSNNEPHHQVDGLDVQRRTATSFVESVQQKLSALVLGSDVPFARHYRGDRRVAASRWLTYNALDEFERLGVQRSRCWVLSGLNANWELSESYPSMLAFPRLASSATVRDAAQFRSKGRLPTLAWLEPTTHAAILRSSQPLVGLLAASSASDNRLLEMVAMANVHSTTLHIVDARPYSNATANRGHGGGFEDCSKMSRLTAQGTMCWRTTISFADIANIHVVRSSLFEIHRLYRSGDGEQAGGRWLSKLESTGWIDHVSRILCAANDVAERVGCGQSCLVHCSDGWDRTAQISSLAMLLCDPYYRTREGFALLVEKEWCSFGHKFADRLGHYQVDSTSRHVNAQVSSDKERSPVFFQFLDCVFQLTRQFEDAFEFTELFLLHLHEHTTSGTCNGGYQECLVGRGPTFVPLTQYLTCIGNVAVAGLYGTFLYNSERERALDAADRRTASVWPSLLRDEQFYLNATFKMAGADINPSATRRRLRPRTGPAHLVPWETAFTRWLTLRTPSPIPVYSSDDDALVV